jgi:hypothetical protein
MKTKFIFLSFLLAILPLISQAQTPPPAHEKTVEFYGKAETTFPLFVGAGVGLNIVDKFDFNLMFGIVPEVYYNVIASQAASYGGNSAYQDVIQSAFQNNWMVRAQGNYYIDTPRAGWFVGGAFSYLQASGKAGTDRVLTAATGRDYSGLRTALLMSGRSAEVDIDSKIMILDARAGYGWDLGSSFTIKGSVGVAKVVSTEVSLKSGLPFYDSGFGHQQMTNAESDLQSIVTDNGITPTISAEISYTF